MNAFSPWLARLIGAPDNTSASLAAAVILTAPRPDLPVRLPPPAPTSVLLPVHPEAASATVDMAEAIPGLAAALRAAAPHADAEKWLGPLTAAFRKNDMTTPQRMSAALGQFAVEAGAGFQEVSEDLTYTHAERLCAVFPSHFKTLADARPCCNNPRVLANVVYANRLGNGPPASGDGFRFAGKGLIQLTGRDEYDAFGRSIGKTAEEAADYCLTPEGAAQSGCWYFVWRKLLGLADTWQLIAITLKVNGNAMLGHADRVAASEAALRAFGG
jgi:predicted chitinase